MFNVVTFFQLLPKIHQTIIGLCSLFILIFIIWPMDQTTNQRVIVDLELNTSYPLELKGKLLAPKLKHANINSSQYEYEYLVQKGDTISMILEQIGISNKQAYEISQLTQFSKKSKYIRPGDKLFIHTTKTKEFRKLHYNLDSEKQIVITFSNGDYQENIIERDIEKRIFFATAEISDNFWNAGIEAGLSPSQIMELANLFGWDIDFALDIRQGDSFSVLFEHRYADGVFVDHGHIVAAEFINQDQKFEAIRHQNGEYYNKEGRSTRKAFLRSPVDFTRVSSNFNLRRLHPVTGRVKPHRGVDYAAPTGTPIKAAGDGRVIKSSYSAYNGNYIFIKHSGNYITKYLHLHKRYVRAGSSIKQGQIIGTVGRTGRATGPHLHYEFIVNGQHRNPRTVILPQPKSIIASDKQDFLNLSNNLLNKIQHHKVVRYAHYDN